MVLWTDSHGVRSWYRGQTPEVSTGDIMDGCPRFHLFFSPHSGSSVLSAQFAQPLGSVSSLLSVFLDRVTSDILCPRDMSDAGN